MLVHLQDVHISILGTLLQLSILVCRPWQQGQAVWMKGFEWIQKQKKGFTKIV